MFKILNENLKEEKKETILLIGSSIFNRYYLFGFAIEFLKYLKEFYNIHILTLESKNLIEKNLDSKSLEYVKEFKIMYLDVEEFFSYTSIDKRKTNDSEEICSIVFNKIYDFLSNKNNLSNNYKKIIIVPEHFLWLSEGSVKINNKRKSLSNFHDYLDDIPEEDKREIDRLVVEYANKDKQWNNPPMIKSFFRFKCIVIHRTLAKIISLQENRDSVQCIVLINDPTIFYKLLKYNNKFLLKNLKNMYFRDDFRGSRELTGFKNMSQLQCIFEKNNNFYSGNVIPFKKKPFESFFVGNVFQNNEWGRLKFLENILFKISPHLDKNKNSFFIPMTKKHYEDKNFKKYCEELEKNSLWKGGVDVFHMDIINNYKYGIISTPRTENDSLSFKPEKYVYLNILPLLEEKYDTANLMLPAWTKECIYFKDADELLERINYFNNNPDKAQEIIDRLKEEFNFYDFEQNTRKYVIDFFEIKE